MAKQGYCHCTARLPNSGRCAYGCSVWADPEHLSQQEHKRKANEEHRRLQERPFITPDDVKRMRNALAKFDPWERARRKRCKRVAAIAAGGRR